MDQRDVVIIGGGPAGYAAAIRVSQLGGKATLIEEDVIGGTCLNRGCIPTRSLARGVELLELGKAAKDYGIVYKDISFDFSKMLARKDLTIKTLVGGVKLLLDGNGVEVISGAATLKSASKLQVRRQDNSTTGIAARKMIVAAGSCCKNIAMGRGNGRVLNTTEALQLSAVPYSVLIVGGGFVGVTFAIIFAKLGARVTIAEESSRILSHIDREIGEILERELKSNRIKTHTECRVAAIEDDEDGQTKVTLDSKGQPIAVSVQSVLAAEAREAATNGLGLNEIGIRFGDQGGVAVNKRMETNLPGVYAAGDITMQHMWTPAAYVEGITAAENAMGRSTEMDYTAVPFWTSTIPEISGVGMTEEEAIAAGYRLRIGRFPFAANGMATILGQRTGMVKIIADERYGQILGVHIIGPGATDLIAGAALAMRLDVTPEDIGATFHAHPSLSEAIWEAAKDVNNETIHFLRQS